MNSTRKTAVLVGIMFILATVANVVGNLSFVQPVLESPDMLASAAVNGNKVIWGGLLELIAAIAVVNIVVWLYPLLRKSNEGLALGALSFRLIESIFYIVVVLSIFAMLTLGQEAAQASASDSAVFQVGGTILQAIHDWAGKIGVIAFTLGAMMYYSIFYRSKLIPRWLSAWGFLAAASTLTAAVLTMFGVIESLGTLFMVMNMPIALQELVMAVWLIAKGFDQKAIAALSPVPTHKRK